MTGKDERKPILIYNSNKYFIPFFIQKGIPTYTLFREISFTARVLRKISTFIGIPKSAWYSKWPDKVKASSSVIIFADAYRVNNPKEATDLFKYIKNINPAIRIIYWYWNPVAKCINPNEISDALCEKWAFDKADSELYGIKHNSQFYWDNIKLPDNHIRYDVVFVGADKGRRSFIDNIERKMVEFSVMPYFKVVDDQAGDRKYKGPFPFVPYSEYLALVSKSKSILDCVQEGQSGLTLRVLESLFFQKKLITNDKLIKRYDFYHPDNIFIIGVDELKHLKNFLGIPYQPIPRDILKYYDVSDWLRRFIM
jgi:hypothetical protein